MNLALFGESSLREYYDTNVMQSSERRVFNVPDEELCSVPAQKIIENILTILSPGRLVIAPEVNEERHTTVDQRTRIRRWLEFSGSMRLLTLRPRQYYASPPHVSLLQPPASGQSGRIIIEQTVRSIADQSQFDEYCTAEFRKITDYAGWINEDLDSHEQSARAWLLTLIEAKIRRICPDGGERSRFPEHDIILNPSPPGFHNLSPN